jgi:serine/threonine protein phosphatase PrpC
VTPMANATVLRGAGTTNVGRVRSNNEDNYLVQPGLWVVADGMGGHRGGEIASELACETMAEGFDEQTVGGLLDAIDAANTAVHEAGANDPELAGMGTTVVALTLVDQEGEELVAIANVGDSRAYRFTGSELEQLTEDHSLVAEMVREGSISAEEAATHPQRNIVTRVLGVYEEVPVDVFTVTPRHGDRYLLCSDGLFNEVPEDRIAAVLRRLADPGEAADELVRLSLEGGGRDNVTVVVVDVLSDGGQAEAASAALSNDGTATHEAPRVGRGGAYAEPFDEEDVLPGRKFRRARHRRDDGGPLHSVRRPRRFTWRVFVFGLLVLLLLAGAGATVYWYGRSAYYVGFDGDDVAVFRGRPGGVLWINPTLEETTRLDRDDIPEALVDTLEAGKQVSSRDEATAYVTRIEERAFETQQREAATTTTTAPTTTTLPSGEAP